jgi:putative phosphoribosyl transferase
MLFRDRFDAGRQLAQKLLHYQGQKGVLVLALPRGGVPVAFEVAKAIGAPLDLFLVRKLGLPRQPELAMGAVATGGVEVINDKLLSRLGVPRAVVDRVADHEQRVLEQQQQKLRGRRPPPAIPGRTVILVDDGLATGSTMRAAVEAIRRQSPERIVIAVPVGAAETCDEFRRDVDEVITVVCPEDFYAVAMWYDDFRQTTDEIVVSLLKEAQVGGNEREAESQSASRPVPLPSTPEALEARYDSLNQPTNRSY